MKEKKCLKCTFRRYIKKDLKMIYCIIQGSQPLRVRRGCMAFEEGEPLLDRIKKLE